MVATLAGASAYDVVLYPPDEEPLGLMLYRRARRVNQGGGIGPYQVTGGLVSEAPTTEQHWVRQDYDDWSAGSFYSRRIVTNGHAWTENGDASVPGLFLPSGALTEVSVTAGAGQILCSAELDGDLYFGAGRYVLRVPGGGNGPAVAVRDFGSSATVRSAVIFNGKLYVSGSGMLLARYPDQPGAWGEATFGRRYLATVYWTTQDQGAWRLVGSDAGNGVHHNAGDPFRLEDWTPQPFGGTKIPIGNEGDDIAGIVAAPRHVYFLKPQTGIHTLDARGYAPTLTPYWGHSHTIQGQSSGLIHEGYLYSPTRQGLDRLDVSQEGLRQDNPGWCHPGYGLPNETPVRGEITALTAVEGWVVVAVYNGTDSYICWGKDRTKIGLEGLGPMVWYTKVTIPGEVVTHLRPGAPNGVPRLWIGSVSSSGVTRLRWLSLPKGGNPIQELLWGGAHRFATSCTLVTSSDIWGNAAARKTMRRLGVTSERLGDIASFAIDLAADSTSTDAWVEQQVVRQSPYDSFLTTQETGYRTTLRVRGTGSPTLPPILRGLVPRADLYVEQDELRAYQVVLGEGVTTRNGTVDDRDQGSVYERLKYLAEIGHMTMRDELGTELEVIVQPVLPFEVAEAPTPTGDTEQRVVTMTVSVVDAHWYWDSGASYDSGKVWS